MAMSGFGGVMPFAYRHIVERRKWYTAAEFAEMLALGQVLPGPSICNVAVMIGWRKAGAIGAAAALAGLLVGPAIAVVLLGVLYEHFHRVPLVQRALAGMSAVAAGLIIAVAVDMSLALFRERRAAPIELGVAAALIGLAFVAVGLAHWPLLAVVATLGPIAIGLTWWRHA